MAFDRITDIGLPAFIEAERDPQALWLFVHIPKTAGSSLANEIARLRKPYRNIHIDYTLRDVSNEQQMQGAVDRFIDDARSKRFRAASGHISIDHAREIRAAIPGTKFVTVLREPAVRVVSDFRYARTPRHPPYRDFIERYPTIEDYIADPLSQDKMSKHLGGSDPATVFAEFDFIGILEMYPLSFNVLFALMGESVMPKIHERKTESTADNAVQVSQELLDRINAVNQGDVKIFAAVRDALRDRRDEWRGLVRGIKS